LDRAAATGGTRRPWIGDRERRRVRLGRADAPGVGAGEARERPVQHAREADHLVASAEEVDALGARGEAAVRARMPHELAAVGQRERPVLDVVAVVEDHAPTRELVEIRRVAGRAGYLVGGELAWTPACVEFDLAVARELEILADDE